MSVLGVSMVTDVPSRHDKCTAVYACSFSVTAVFVSPWASKLCHHRTFCTIITAALCCRKDVSLLFGLSNQNGVTTIIASATLQIY